MKTAQSIKEAGKQSIEDKIISFLQNNNLMANPEYPQQYIYKIDDSHEFRKLTTLTMLIDKVSLNEEISGVGEMIYDLAVTMEHTRMIYQVCLQILTGRLEDKEWLISAYKEIESISSCGIDVKIDRVSGQLLGILKEDGRCID